MTLRTVTTLTLLLLAACAGEASISDDVDPCMIPGVEECAPACDEDAYREEGFLYGISLAACSPDVLDLLDCIEANIGSSARIGACVTAFKEDAPVFFCGASL